MLGTKFAKNLTTFVDDDLFFLIYKLTLSTLLYVKVFCYIFINIDAEKIM